MKYARLLGVVVVATGLTTFTPAFANPDVNHPNGAYGAVNVLASAATKVPTSPLNGRNGIAILNNGPNTIWCGWDSSVATTTGWPVSAGGTLSLDVSFATTDTATGKVFLWCIASTADQASPSNTRYLEVK